VLGEVDETMAHLPAERWNFGILLVQGVARRIANELSSERLVLPFLYAALGGPVLFAGVFAPAVIVGRLAAQLLGSQLVAMARRTKLFLSATTGFSALVLFLLAAFADTLRVGWLPVAFVAASVAWGMSNGFGALTAQDLLGRVLGERARINLLFAIGAASGAGVIVVTIASQWIIGVDQAKQSWDDQVHLIWAGITMLLLSTVAASALVEGDRPVPSRPAGATREGYLTLLRDGMRTVSRLDWFRRFMIARVLLVTVELVMPFFAVHAAAFHAHTAPSLTVFVVSASLGMIAGGLVLPRLGHKSIQLVLSVSCGVAALAALTALVSHLIPDLRSLYTHAAMIFLLGFAAQGALDGSTAYVVGASTDEQRPYAIAVTNFAAGAVGVVIALVAGTIALERGAIFAVALMGLINLFGAYYVRTLPDVQTKSDP
jgi:MFS family permease